MSTQYVWEKDRNKVISPLKDLQRTSTLFMDQSLCLKFAEKIRFLWFWCFFFLKYDAFKKPSLAALSVHKVFISRQETDSFVSFFLRFICSKIADLSNQRDVFCHCALVLRICRIKSVEYAWPQQTFATKANFFFLQYSSFFSPSVCFYSTK